MRKQNANPISGEERAKTRVLAHAGPEIAPPRTTADARAANSNNDKDNKQHNNKSNDNRNTKLTN